MKKKQFITLLASALAFGALSFASAEEVNTNTYSNTGTGGRDAYNSDTVQRTQYGDGMMDMKMRMNTTDSGEALQTNLDARRDEMDARREDLREEFEAKRASSSMRRMEWQQHIAERKLEHTTRLMLATIKRLEQIIARIESRIVKIQNKGGDVTKSKEYVNLAKGNLADAKTLVESFTTIDLSSTDAQTNFERVRAAAAEAREHIRAAHRNLMLAVRNLSARELGLPDDNDNDNDNDDDDDDNATTTNGNTATTTSS